VQTQARAVEDLRIQVTTIVDDDEERRTRAEKRPRALEHRSDPVRVGGERGAARACRGGAELALAPVVEAEELIGVAVLLVVVDQSRIRRRGDDGVEPPAQLDLERVAVHDLDLASRAQARERLQPGERVERVTAHEAGCLLDGLALAPVLVTPVRLTLRGTRQVEIEMSRQPRRA